MFSHLPTLLSRDLRKTTNYGNDPPCENGAEKHGHCNAQGYAKAEAICQATTDVWLSNLRNIQCTYHIRAK